MRVAPKYALPLAASKRWKVASATLTSSQKTRVGGFRIHPPGRCLEQPPQVAESAPDYSVRSYETVSGQGFWPSRDPKGEAAGTNLYRYLGNSPLNGIDPLGLDHYREEVFTKPMYPGNVGNIWQTPAGTSIKNIAVLGVGVGTMWAGGAYALAAALESGSFWAGGFWVGGFGAAQGGIQASSAGQQLLFPESPALPGGFFELGMATDCPKNPNARAFGAWLDLGSNEFTPPNWGLYANISLFAADIPQFDANYYPFVEAPEHVAFRGRGAGGKW